MKIKKNKDQDPVKVNLLLKILQDNILRNHKNSKNVKVRKNNKLEAEAERIKTKVRVMHKMQIINIINLNKRKKILRKRDQEVELKKGINKILNNTFKRINPPM